MADNLRDAGTWIHAHSEAIFNTTYWYIAPEEGNLRFTQSNDAFYIMSLEQPPVGRLEVSAKVPIVEGDSVLGVTLDGEFEIAWGITDDGKLWLDVTDEVVDADRYCWVFKVVYQG
jgi:hypothetical protein